MERMCDMCGIRPATSFTSYTINGVTTEQYLCSECAKKYNLAMDFSPDNIIASVFGMPKTRPRTLRVCKVCGATERDILDNYKFGCSECYNTFKDIATDVARQLASGNHVGKRPYKLSGANKENGKTVAPADNKSMTDEERIESLRRQLRKAVDEERFDDASRLKKEIDSLKKEDK